MTRTGVEGLEAELVEDQEISAAEGFQNARMTPVAARERLLAELGPAMNKAEAAEPADHPASLSGLIRNRLCVASTAFTPGRRHDPR